MDLNEMQQLIDMYKQFFKEYGFASVAFCTTLLYNPEIQYEKYFKDCEHIFSDSTLYKNTIQYFQPLNDNYQYSQEFLNFYNLARKIKYLFNKITQETQETKQLLQNLPVDDVTLTVQTKEYKVSQILRFIKFSLYQLQQKYTEEQIRNLTFIDMGTGKGYILTHLAYTYSLQSIGVDASIQHVVSCCRRLQSLKKNNEKKLKRYVEQMCQKDQTYKERMQYYNITSDSMYPLIKLSANYIDDKTSLIQLDIQSQSVDQITEKYKNQFQDIERLSLVSHKRGDHIYGEIADKVSNHPITQQINQNKKYVILALHACGDFSVNSMQLINNQDVAAVFNIPCCYQRLTETKYCLTDWCHNIYQQYLQSQYHIEPMIEQNIPKHILVNAAASYRQSLEDEIRTVDSNLKRAILEYIRYQKLDRESYLKTYPYKAIAMKENLIELCKQNIKLETGQDLTEDDIQIIQQLYSEYNITLMKTYTVFRKISGQIIESMIILDRMCHFGYQCQSILEETSDRNKISRYCVIVIIFNFHFQLITQKEIQQLFVEFYKKCNIQTLTQQITQKQIEYLSTCELKEFLKTFDFNFQDNDTKSTFAHYLAQNFIIPPKQYSCNPTIRDKFNKTVGHILALNGIDIPKYLQHEPYLQDNNLDTVAMLQTRHEIIPEKQWIHDKYIRNKFNETVQSIMIKNKMKVPQIWQYPLDFFDENGNTSLMRKVINLLQQYDQIKKEDINNILSKMGSFKYLQEEVSLKNNDNNTVASILAQKGIQIPQQYSHDPNIKVTIQQIPIAMILLKQRKIVPKEWICNPLIKDIDGNTPAMISAQNKMFPQKEFNHDPLIINNDNQTVASILEIQGIKAKKPWIYDKLQTFQHKQTTAMVIASQGVIPSDQWNHDPNLVDTKQSTVGMKLARMGVQPLECWVGNPSLQDHKGMTIAMYLAQQGIDIPQYCYHDSVLANKHGFIVAMFLAQKGIIPDKCWLKNIEQKNDKGQTVETMLKQYNFIYYNNEFIVNAVVIKKDAICCICLQSGSSDIVKTKCGHDVCKECFKQICLQQKFNKCPVCRSDIWFEQLQ